MPRNKQISYIHIKVWNIDGNIRKLHFAIYSLAPGCRLGTESSLLEVKVADLSSGKMIHSLTLRSMKYWNIYKYYTRDSHLINVDWTIHAQCDDWWMTISRRWILSRYLGIVTCYSPRSRHWPGWRASGHSRAWVPTSCVLAALCSAMEHYCYIIAALLAPISWQIARCCAVTRDVNESSRSRHHIWRSQLP